MRDEQQQHNSAGAVQVNGDHNTVNVNHHTHHHQHEHHHNTVHAHGPVVLQMAPAPRPDFALQAPPAPARLPRAAPRPKYDLTPAQRALLALMRQLSKPERAAVVDWMRRQHGTSLVMDMTPAQVQQCRVQVQAVLRDGVGLAA